MGNILIGVVFIVGGLSGKLALKGTNSGPARGARCGACGVGSLPAREAERQKLRRDVPSAGGAVLIDAGSVYLYSRAFRSDRAKTSFAAGRAV
jgi:hypothetical protein